MTPDFTQELTIYFWMEIAAFMEEGNQRLFSSRQHTRDLIKNGDYAVQLAHYQNMLHGWRNDFDLCGNRSKSHRP